MNKLESMRAHLLAIPGELKIDPDDLMTFADQGTVYSASSGTNRHFEMRYKANIIIQELQRIGRQAHVLAAAVDGRAPA